MKNVLPLHAHKLREVYFTRNEAAVSSRTQLTDVGECDANKIDSTSMKPPMTAAAYKLRKKLESL